MFSAWCNRFDKEVLIWPNALKGIDNTEEGVVVHYVCACGAHVEMLTGASRKTELTVHAAS